MINVPANVTEQPLSSSIVRNGQEWSWRSTPQGQTDAVLLQAQRLQFLERNLPDDLELPQLHKEDALAR